MAKNPTDNPELLAEYRQKTAKILAQVIDELESHSKTNDVANVLLHFLVRVSHSWRSIEVLDRECQETFLIDHPTFPSGGRTTVLGVKNRTGCYYFWRSTDENMKVFKRQPISAELFDQIFDRLHSLKQRGFENMGGPEKAYAGFLSTLQAGQSRQVLLHINDFLEFDVENQEIIRVGRIFEIENSLQVNNN